MCKSILITWRCGHHTIFIDHSECPDGREGAACDDTEHSRTSTTSDSPCLLCVNRVNSDFFGHRHRPYSVAPRQSNAPTAIARHPAQGLFSTRLATIVEPTPRTSAMRSTLFTSGGYGGSSQAAAQSSAKVQAASSAAPRPRSPQRSTFKKRGRTAAAKSSHSDKATSSVAEPPSDGKGDVGKSDAKAPKKSSSDARDAGLVNYVDSEDSDEEEEVNDGSRRSRNARKRGREGDDADEGSRRKGR